ncbi:MAG: hypothetical protein ABIL01_05045 [Pseudomonadota bacterium]
MIDDGEGINQVGNVSGSNNSFFQFYAPNQEGLREEAILKLGNSTPFSINWLLFSERSIPFYGRENELADIQEFLRGDEDFAWWALVGDGGSGKSRLCLEVLESLPASWNGGFIAKENISARDAGAWQPAASTLWIIDYAAGYHSQIRAMIPLFIYLSSKSKFKIRLLLIDRSFNEEGGWWAELMGIGRERAAIVSSLYRQPLVLPSLVKRALPFLGNVVAALPDKTAKHLRDALETVTEDWILERSDHGNPLILLLLASALISSKAEAADTLPSDANKVVEAYLGRELALLRDRCNDAGLKFSGALDLLFIATSAFPLDYVLESDFATLFTENQEVMLIKDVSGKYRFPTFAEVGEFGLGLMNEQNKMLLTTLATVTEIDDVEVYLALLDEVGFSKYKRWSLQPDLLGEALMGLVVNSSRASVRLKQKRGDYNRQHATALVAGCLAISTDNCVRSWARLDDVTLMTLVLHLRQSKTSIRGLLLVVRLLGMARSNKLPFSSEVIFGYGDGHMEALSIGQYFDDVRLALKQNALSEEIAQKLAAREHAWLLPYFEFLLDLEKAEKLRLASIICLVDSNEQLQRLTNVLNFAFVLSKYTDQIVSDRTFGQWEILDAPIGQFVDGVVSFMCNRLFPTLIASGDADFKEPYKYIARALVHCAYGVLNDRFHRRETTDSKKRVRDALAVGRKVLQFAPDEEDLANLERNFAALNMQVLNPSDVMDGVRVYLEILKQMENYARPKDYTGTLTDFLAFGVNRRLAEVIDAAGKFIIGEASPGCIDVYAFARFGARAADHAGDEGYSDEEMFSILFPIALFLLDLVRETTSTEIIENFERLLLVLTSLSSSQQEIQNNISKIFFRAEEIMTKETCSNEFRAAVLKIAAAFAFLRKASDGIPFEFDQSEIDEESMIRARVGIPRKKFSKIIDKIYKSTVIHKTSDGAGWGYLSYHVVLKEKAFVREGRYLNAEGRNLMNRVVSNLGPTGLGSFSHGEQSD